MGKKTKLPKRANRMTGVGDALGGVLAPALKKRGFAGRDLIDHWASIVPSPYDRAAAPDRLDWPRSADRGDGAVLHVRCAPGHALALAHEGDLLAAAINRYFGFVLVSKVRRSAMAFTPGSPATKQDQPSISPQERDKVSQAVQNVGDDGLREALRIWGEAIASAKRR